jgi:Na+-translocating ferredoxin:NAD+ oxidoreductase subunit G
MNSVVMIRFLGVLSLICGMLIVGVNSATHARIQINQETILRESLTQLLPGMDHQTVYVIEPSGELTVHTGGETTAKRLFAGYDKSGKLLGVVLEASERGYADIISAMYAYSPSTKTVTGFTVVEMRETPGLGNKIGTDPDFLANFKALDASHPITAVKHGTKKNPWEIDAISGATISSRAVGRLLANSIREMEPVIQRNKERIERGN